MDDQTELLIEQRLSVFSDEPDLNDWFEVMCGAAMAVLGLFHLVTPGELVDPDLMRWFAASVVAAGAVWATWSEGYGCQRDATFCCNDGTQRLFIRERFS